MSGAKTRIEEARKKVEIYLVYFGRKSKTRNGAEMKLLVRESGGHAR